MFIEKLKDPVFENKLWLEGFQYLFRLDRFIPIQQIYFYVYDGKSINRHKWAKIVSNITFNQFRNLKEELKEEYANNVKNKVSSHEMIVLGPHIAEDSAMTEMLDIIHLYERRPATNPTISSLI